MYLYCDCHLFNLMSIIIVKRLELSKFKKIIKPKPCDCDNSTIEYYNDPTELLNEIKITDELIRLELFWVKRYIKFSLLLLSLL